MNKDTPRKPIKLDLDPRIDLTKPIYEQRMALDKLGEPITHKDAICDLDPSCTDPFFEVEIFMGDSQRNEGTIFVEVQAPDSRVALIKAISRFRPLDEDEYFAHISVSGPRDKRVAK